MYIVIFRDLISALIFVFNKGVSTHPMGYLQINFTGLPRLTPRPTASTSTPVQPPPFRTDNTSMVVEPTKEPILVIPVVPNHRVRNQRKPILPRKRLKVGSVKGNNKVENVSDSPESKVPTEERRKKVVVCWPKPERSTENGTDSVQNTLNSALHDMPWIKDHKFKCGICNKYYNSKQVLKRHLNMHRGIYSYTCSICGKGYTSRSNLRGHVASQHTKVKEFRCRLCGTEFTTKYWLKDHVKIKHDMTLEQMEGLCLC